MERITIIYLLVIFGLMSSMLSCRQDESRQSSDRPEIEVPPLDTSGFAGSGEREAGFTEDYLSSNRGIWQKPELVLDLLGDLENKTVADIGAGTGFFALRLTPLAKKVIAVDIDPRFINFLDSLKVRVLDPAIQARLETRLATPDDPNLKEGEADIVLIVNTFMYIKNRVNYLEVLRESISQGGTLIIIDFKKKRSPVGPPSDIRIPLFQVEDELHQAGFNNIETNDTALDYQYVIIARN